MNISELLGRAKQADHKALLENESKRLLEKYDVPVVREIVAFDKEEAVNAALEIGFPVVLKGLGPTLLHKTERGLVHLNLTNPQAVNEAAVSIFAEAGNEIEGLLIQPQVEGKREFVAGLFQDEQFGPVVMFGLGGYIY
jgi:acyl-CoA synthetase (NDP forming)